MQERPSQTIRLYDLLSDGLAHRTDEIVAKIYSGGALARVGARIWDVQKKYGLKIDGWHDKSNPKLYWYQIRTDFLKDFSGTTESRPEDMPEYREFKIINNIGQQAQLTI